jgi:hypothetical protein
MRPSRQKSVCRNVPFSPILPPTATRMVNNRAILAPPDRRCSSPPPWSIRSPICCTASSPLLFKGRGDKRASFPKPRLQQSALRARPRHCKQQNKLPLSMNTVIKTGSRQEISTIHRNRISHNSIDRPMPQAFHDEPSNHTP